MDRLEELDELYDRFEAIGLSTAERQTVIDLLIEGKTHREAGNGNRWTSAKRMQRARAKAAAHGITIPNPHRSFTRVTLTDVRARQIVI